MSEANKMKEMPVNKLMIQMGIPMILSMALHCRPFRHYGEGFGL